MLRKTLIGTLVLALTPALAFAAPAPMTMKERPAVTHTVKLQKKMHMLKKAEKIRLIQKHRAVQKMKAAARVRHRTVTHKI